MEAERCVLFLQERAPRVGSDAHLMSAGLEVRRNSAPELEVRWISDAPNGLLKMQHLSRVKHVQKLMQPNVLQPAEVKPSPETGHPTPSWLSMESILNLQKSVEVVYVLCCACGSHIQLISCAVT